MSDIIKTPIVVIFTWLFQPKNDLLQVLPVPSAQRWTSFRLILWMVLTTASALAAGFAMRCGFFLSPESWRRGLIVRLICRRIRFRRLSWSTLASLATLPGPHSPLRTIREQFPLSNTKVQCVLVVLASKDLAWLWRRVSGGNYPLTLRPYFEEFNQLRGRFFKAGI